MNRNNKLGYLTIIVFCIGLYWQFWFKGLIPAPFDTLVGAYYPWLDYKWGTITGVPVKNALPSDSFSQFYIWKYLAVDQLKEGKLPIWNPYVFSGTPLLATFHSAVLFPANILLFLPKPWSWGLYIFGASFTALITMYLLLGKFTKQVIARILGAIVFATAGPMTTWTEFGTAIWAMAFWPILFLLPTLRYQKLYLYSFSFIFASLILAGNVQIVTYFIPLFIFWLLFIKKFKIFFIGIFLGLAIASIQIVPTLDLYNKSIRADEQYSADFNYGLTPISNLIRFWSADFFGNPSTGNHWSPISYHENTGFLSTIAVILILSLFFYKNKNLLLKFWMYIFWITIFFLTTNPISKLIFSMDIPLLTYSSVSRLMFVTAFSGGIMVALALNKLSHLKKSSFIILFFTIVNLFFVPNQYLVISLRNVLLPLVMTLMIIFLANKKYLILFVTVFIMFDMWRYFTKYNPFTPSEYAFPITPVINYLQKYNEGYRFIKQKTNLLPLNTWTPYGLSSPEGYDPLHLLSYHRSFHLLNNKPLTNKVSRYAELEDINLTIINNYSIKHYVSKINSFDPVLDKLINTGWKKVFVDGHVSIYENPDELNRINKSTPEEFILPVVYGSLISGVTIILLILVGSLKISWWR